MWGIMGAAAAGSLANLVGAAASILIYSKLTGVPAANMYRIRREELRDFVFSLKARFGRQTSA
jgi:Na+-driven multidrug efflux pump